MVGAADKKETEIASLNEQADWLTQQLRLMQGQRFGMSSEQTQVLSGTVQPVQRGGECG